MNASSGLAADLESWWNDHGDDLISATAWIVGILVVAWLVSALSRRAISRAVNRLAARQTDASGRRPGSVLDSALDSALARSGERRAQRAQALGSVLRSAVTIVVFTVALFMILGQLGVQLGPILASAGIVGVALGFGAQNLVKDFLAGIFVVIEDQYGVGDFIDSGLASGTVEEVGLRITKLRDPSGVIWYVRNGEIVRVGNKTRGRATTFIDIVVAYDESLDKVREIIDRTARALATDETWASRFTEMPEVLGVESIEGDAITIRLMVKTPPDARFDVPRELRARLKRAFDQEGISVPVRPFGFPGPAGGQPP